MHGNCDAAPGRFRNIGEAADDAVTSRNRKLAQSNLRGVIFFLTDKNGTIEGTVGSGMARAAFYAVLARP